MPKPPLILGSHMSVTGGLEQAVLRAQALGCNAVQFFSKSNRQWASRALTHEEIDVFKKTLAQSTIVSTTIHASYLINIGSPDPLVAERSRIALADEYERACLLDVDHLVLHPGSHLKNDETDCLNRIANHINIILDTAPAAKTKLVLETMAGQGSGVCHTFEQIAHIIKHIHNKDRIGVCLDTCHVFAAGYDLSRDYNGVIQQFDTILGLERLSVIHVNDSKKELGSRVDRHEHIGKGYIGIDAFRALFNDPRLVHISKILETPKESESDDIQNIAIIRELIN
jgi:deoxyribonuclease-4